MFVTEAFSITPYYTIAVSTKPAWAKYNNNKQQQLGQLQMSQLTQDGMLLKTFS